MNTISKINYFEDLERLTTVKEKIIFLFERYGTLTKMDVMKHLKLSHQTVTGRLAKLKSEGIIQVLKTKRNRNGYLVSVYKLTPTDEVAKLKQEYQDKKKSDLISRLLKFDLNDDTRKALINELTDKVLINELTE